MSAKVTKALAIYHGDAAPAKKPKTVRDTTADMLLRERVREYRDWYPCTQSDHELGLISAKRVDFVHQVRLVFTFKMI